MKTASIQFRDKNDFRPLPPIPAELVDGMQELFKTKVNQPGITLFEKLEAIYTFTDRFNAYVATFAVCQRGCSHCCKMDVNVSRLEAEYITKNGGPMLDQGIQHTYGHHSACPFLSQDDTCTVYNHRPFNCRTFHTLDDPKYCAKGTETHQVYGASGAGYGVGFYKAVATWLKYVHEDRSLPYRDIRDWFPVGAPQPKVGFLQQL